MTRRLFAALAALAAAAALTASAAQVTCTGSIDLVAGGKISVALECPALTPSTPAGPTTPITPTQPPCQTMGGIPIGTGCGGTVGTLTPTTPPAGPATTPPTSTTSERAPYVQTRVGDILGGGFWRVSMAFPGEAHETAFSIGPGDGRRWMLDGDNGWQQGDLTVSVNGQPVDRGQAIFGPGNWRIRAEAVDNAHTREHGVGATAIQLFRIQ